ncbi:MAG TPA: VWA domain-containing protein [Pyrinomonadaceae bacterium]
MNRTSCSRRLTVPALLLILILGAAGNLNLLAQSRRQPPTTNQKKNKRPGEGGQQQEEEKQEPLPPDVVGKPQEAERLTVTTALVNVDAVVYHKKSNQIITGLKKENFAIFEDGVRKEITNFSTPEAPITVAMVVEYSKLSAGIGYVGSGGMEAGQNEVLRPMAMFLSQFVRPPEDYVSVIAYDIRPTPLTDFTNDPKRISQVINLMLRNSPAFRDSNLYDAIRFTLVGGKGDAVVLDQSKEQTADYAGLAALTGRRKAMIMITTGIDTFSKTNFDKVRKIVQNSGVPIYIIGTGNLFFKKYGDELAPTDDIMGNPGRMTFLQAQSALTTFAKETGGMYLPVTFPGEVPTVLKTINSLLRNQYSLGYNPGEQRDGKQHKIVVKVDVNGDGQLDDKEYIVQSRQFYNAPKG